MTTRTDLPNPFTPPAERVKLTEQQKLTRDEAEDSYIASLVRQSRDDSDPEARDNARRFLESRGVR